MEFIFGIAGPSLSGKDIAAEYLAKRFKLTHIKLGDIVREEAEKRHLTSTKLNLREVGNDMRASFSPSILADTALRRYKHNKKEHNGLIISDIRHPSEARAIEKANGILFYIDATQSTRYARSQTRMEPEDSQSFDEFQKEESVHAHPIHEYDQDLESVRSLSTYNINNDSSKEIFYQKLESQVNVYIRMLIQQSNPTTGDLIRSMDSKPL